MVRRIASNLAQVQEETQASSLDTAATHVAATRGSQDFDYVLSSDELLVNTDWAFLNVLGDADDELYSMNNDFRDFLANGLKQVDNF